jgi:probable HAF family extracellular repeat protein
MTDQLFIARPPAEGVVVCANLGPFEEHAMRDARSRTARLWLSALFMLVICPIEVRGALPRYIVTDLGDIGYPTGINDYGQITGSRYGTTTSGFLWTPSEANGSSGTFATLDKPNWATHVFPYAINARGQIVGDFNGFNRREAFLWNPIVPNAGAGSSNLLGFGQYSSAFGINSTGQVAGSNSEDQPVLWTPDVPNGITGMAQQLFGIGEEGYGSAGAVNNAGLVSGTYRFDGTNNSQAFLHDGVTVQQLGTLGYSQSYGGHVNSLGQVIGNLSASTYSHGFLYDGQMHDLGTLDNSLSGLSSWTTGINDQGYIIGGSYGGRHYSEFSPDELPAAFLYTPNTGMIDLNLRIAPGSKWILSQASAINNLGQITGYGYFNEQDEVCAFLLTPLTTEFVPGDFNWDGAVDGDDLAQWQEHFGWSGRSDADDDGDSDGDDFLVWQRQLNAPTAQGDPVPEPNATAQMTMAFSALIMCHSRRGRLS